MLHISNIYATNLLYRWRGLDKNRVTHYCEWAAKHQHLKLIVKKFTLLSQADLTEYTIVWNILGWVLNEHKFINTWHIYKSPVAWCLLYEGLSLSALKARDLMFSLLAFKMDFTFFTEKRNEHCGKGILLMTCWKNIWQLTAKSSQL